MEGKNLLRKKTEKSSKAPISLVPTVKTVFPLEKTAGAKKDSFLEKEQRISEENISSYTYSNSSTRTRLQSDIVKYTWEIDDFYYLYNSYKMVTSPAFPETAEYQIHMDFDKSTKMIRFSIYTECCFTVSCSITIEEPSNLCATTKTFNGYIKGNTYLFEQELKNLIPETLTISCELRIFRQLLNNSVYTPLISTNLEVKAPFSICSSCNCKFDDTKVIKFIINGKSCSVSKHSLCTTNSRFFKDLCEKIVKKEMINEVKIQNCEDTFEDVLIYIQTGLIRQLVNYEELLKAAHKYDIQDLKLICEEYLLCKVTENTAVKYVKLALLNDAKCLADHAATIIKLYYDKVIYSEEFKLLQQEDCDKINELIAKSALCKDSKVL